MERNIMDELEEIEKIKKRTFKRRMLANFDKVVMSFLIMIFTIFFEEKK